MEVMTEGGRYLAWISHVGGRWEADLRSWCGDHLGTQATSSGIGEFISGCAAHTIAGGKAAAAEQLKLGILDAQSCTSRGINGVSASVPDNCTSSGK
jgi:hypothetical protein